MAGGLFSVSAKGVEEGGLFLSGYIFIEVTDGDRASILPCTGKEKGIKLTDVWAHGHFDVSVETASLSVRMNHERVFLPAHR